MHASCKLTNKLPPSAPTRDHRPQLPSGPPPVHLPAQTHAVQIARHPVSHPSVYWARLPASPHPRTAHLQTAATPPTDKQSSLPTCLIKHQRRAQGPQRPRRFTRSGHQDFRHNQPSGPGPVRIKHQASSQLVRCSRRSGGHARVTAPVACLNHPVIACAHRKARHQQKMRRVVCAGKALILGRPYLECNGPQTAFSSSPEVRSQPSSISAARYTCAGIRVGVATRPALNASRNQAIAPRVCSTGKRRRRQ